MKKEKAFQFEDIIHREIEKHILSNRSVVKWNKSIDHKNELLTYELYFENFNITILYEDVTGELDYSFLELSNNSISSRNSLHTRFHFPFSNIEYSIYDVHNGVLDNQFLTYEFHYLRNEENIETAFNNIFGFIERHTYELNNPSQEFIERINNSFWHDAAIISKKITLEKLEKTPDKYYDKLRNGLFFKGQESSEYFNDFLSKDKRSQLEKYLAKKSAKDKLLTYEKRFFDYLLDHDFNYNFPHLIEQIKEDNKFSQAVSSFEVLTQIICIVIAYALNFVLSEFTDRIFFQDYIILSQSISFNSFILIIIESVFINFMLRKPIEKLFFKNKKISEAYNGRTQKSFKVISIISIPIVIISMVYGYFYNQKALAINDNGIYYCDSIGDARVYDWDDESIELFIIDGCYTEYDSGEYYNTNEDKIILTVFNKDYENYIESNYFFDDDEITFKDVESLINKHKDITHFKAICDYDNAMIIENQ